MDWKELVISIPDYPKPGIIFKDITPLLANGKGFSAAIEEMAQFCEQDGFKPDVLACPEARGFIFASALAQRLGIGFIPLRKPGKLPRPVASLSFDLEYGQDRLEIHKDDIKPNMRVMMVDDVLATGGTMAACVELIEKLGAKVIGAAFLLEIAALEGKEKLKDIPILSLIKE
ncbi:adenine phosphoribosyltransferase [Suttonella ornithocola]|uniref:Adenine phosphoribosyltransferase n=1 Tax=Suttonella ornithocola TaxID=279832 RepID=A0A380MZ65_9GAMM|nr:adenine phosphoribosyltransferase [Suttonella ornithocola]SUO97849.1 Adenine phosphoribosyltransferase [Suttonella ornithocola]